MIDKNRQHQRVNKILTILYCIADFPTKHWDMSVIKNISAGGVMFLAPGDVKFNGKTIYLKIGIPELAPLVLELEAIVIDAKPCFNVKICEVRARFINLSDENKVNLTIIEKIIQKQENKDM